MSYQFAGTGERFERQGGWLLLTHTSLFVSVERRDRFLFFFVIFFRQLRWKFFLFFSHLAVISWPISTRHYPGLDGFFTRGFFSILLGLLKHKKGKQASTHDFRKVNGLTNLIFVFHKGTSKSTHLTSMEFRLDPKMKSLMNRWQSGRLGPQSEKIIKGGHQATVIFMEMWASLAESAPNPARVGTARLPRTWNSWRR